MIPQESIVAMVQDLVAKVASSGAGSREEAFQAVEKALHTATADANVVRQQRYQVLVRQRRLGKLNAADAQELADIEDFFKSEPAPPEFQEAMQAMARDRALLRESMQRIEQLLAQHRA